MRISVLDLAGRLPSPESMRHTWFHRWFGDRIFHPDLWMPCRSSLAMGLAIGWFFGLLPFFGLHIALALLFSLLFRGHFQTAVLGTFISNPLTAPGILMLQYGLGRWMIRPVYAVNDAQETLLRHGIPFGVGSLASACGFAVAGYLGAWCFWGWRRGATKH